jgi:TrbC/VIRB2 pilin
MNQRSHLPTVALGALAMLAAAAVPAHAAGDIAAVLKNVAALASSSVVIALLTLVIVGLCVMGMLGRMDWSRVIFAAVLAGIITNAETIARAVVG